VVSIPVAHAAARPDASSAILILDAALAVLSVAGIETLVFGLVPLYFLEGDTLRRWSPQTWISIWSVGVLWFALVVVDPALNREAKEARASLAWLVILLVAEATISIGLWSYFAIRTLAREREQGTAAQQPAPEPELEPEPESEPPAAEPEPEPEPPALPVSRSP
jgi:hypothetical protein